MPRVRLSAWTAGGAPGDVVEVDDDALRQLHRDGRVAEVLHDADGLLPSEAPVAVNTGDDAESVIAPKRRPKKTDQT